MNSKRLLWLALLLPQFAFLLYVAYDEMRDLRHEWQFGSPRIWGCTAFPFYAPGFAMELLGIAAVVGLCGMRWWSRWLYLAWAAVLFATLWQAFFQPPFDDRGILVVPGVVLVTVASCLAPRWRLAVDGN